MSKQMRWDQRRQQERAAHGYAAKQIIPVRLTPAFWRAWKDDPVGMRMAGYHVRKFDGRWKAWIER